MNIIEAIHDPKLLNPIFARGLESWANWLAVLSAVFGLPLDADQLEMFKRLTGRERQPESEFSEAWLIVGRRGGKSFTSALIAVYLACFVDYCEYLSRGERGVLMIVSLNKRQARIIYDYIDAILCSVPMLKAMIVNQTKESIDLNNGISIEVHTCNFRGIRGFTVVGALLDEVAYWRSEDSANPDVEIVNALRPAMSTVPTAKLIALSSPYRSQGVLYAAHRDHYGQDESDTLVIHADSKLMNPRLSQKVIDKAYANDPQAASAEYGAQFRHDLVDFLQPEWVEAALRPQSTDLPPRDDLRYIGFADPSGGSKDSFTLAIGHVENDVRVIDLVREIRPPFIPEKAVQEYSDILKRYRLHKVTGDRYAGVWVKSAFEKHGIKYEYSDKAKSDLYLEALPLFSGGQVELPGSRTLARQLQSLERRTSRTGKDSIDHAPHTRDDVANAACGVLANLSKPVKRIKMVSLSDFSREIEYSDGDDREFFNRYGHQIPDVSNQGSRKWTR